MMNLQELLNFHVITSTNLVLVDNGVDAEAVPVNSSSFITIKDAFYREVKLGKTIISFKLYISMHLLTTAPLQHLL